MPYYRVFHMIQTVQTIEADSPEEACDIVERDDDHSGDLNDSGIWAEPVDD